MIVAFSQLGAILETIIFFIFVQWYTIAAQLGASLSTSLERACKRWQLRAGPAARRFGQSAINRMSCYGGQRISILSAKKLTHKPVSLSKRHR